MKYPCPCCHFLTLGEKPPGTFEICSVCGWEDDDVQFRDPSYAGGANKVSLETARTNFQVTGAIDESSAKHARQPLADDMP